MRNLALLLIPLLCIYCQSWQWNLNQTIAERQSVNTIQKSNNPNILFVQWQYSSSSDYLRVLEKRQVVEVKIDQALKRKSFGNWIAGDLGMGGANMLFEVKDFKESLEVVLKVVKDYQLEKQTVIAQREYISQNNWTYKVIYPRNFKGKFTEM
jgi:hypothetical protein